MPLQGEQRGRACDGSIRRLQRVDRSVEHIGEHSAPLVRPRRATNERDLADRFVGERLDTGNHLLGQYTLVNLNGSYYFSKQTELFARIDNVLDQDYQEIRGFGVPGIAGYAGMNLIW